MILSTTYGDDSGDEDFELLARPKVPAKSGQTSGVKPTSTIDDDAENEESLADFLSQLKVENKGISGVEKSTVDDDPDTKMLEEFEDNDPDPYDSSSYESNFESEEIVLSTSPKILIVKEVNLFVLLSTFRQMLSTMKTSLSLWTMM